MQQDPQRQGNAPDYRVHLIVDLKTSLVNATLLSSWVHDLHCNLNGPQVCSG